MYFRNIIFPFLVLIISFGFMSSQTIANFENIQLPSESFLNNGGVDEGFFGGNIFLPNDYNAEWDAWTGWSISNTTDTLNPSYSNQYSAITGGGNDGSANYAVTYAYDGTTIHLTNAAKGGDIDGVYITNSTVAYMSILNGDAIAKRFGGESGDDPDFFKLVIRKYLDGNMGADSIEFYLADYRFSDNSQNYIVNTWQYIDLQSLGKSDSLHFTLRSSDIGIFGMNTPAYFCIDDLKTMDNGLSNSTEVYSDKIIAYHDNINSKLIIKSEAQSLYQISIVDIHGREIINNRFQDNLYEFDTYEFSTGVYFLLLSEMNRGSRKTVKFIKY